MDPSAPQPPNQAAPKGFFGKIAGKLFAGVAARAQQDAALCQSYAASHGFTYTPGNEQPIVDASGNKSAVMAAGYGIMTQRLSGVVANRKLDTCLWTVRPVNGNSNERQQHYYYGVGRIDLSKTVPSLIIKPLKAGIGLESPDVFKGFKGASKEQLEGNFNDYFDVFTVSDDPVNAFDLLPPNIMAQFIDNDASAGLEFVGNSLYIFLPVKPAMNNKTISIIQQPLFDAAFEDALIQRLVGLADLYGAASATAPAAINPAEVITHNPGFTIKL